MDAEEVIAAYGLARHPEGGWYRETWRAPAEDGARAVGSAILYLLRGGEDSDWHRVDAAEVWQYSAGDTLEIRVWSEGDVAVAVHRLGPDVARGEVLQVIIPADGWQAARPLGAWTLVGCFVAPGFEFEGFELAPDGWEPPVG